MFGLSDRLAIANSTACRCWLWDETLGGGWDSISGGAALREGAVSPQSLSAICLPSQVFPQDSPPRLKRRCKAFMNEFPEVLGRTECEYPFDVCCSVCPAARYVCAQFHIENKTKWFLTIWRLFLRNFHDRAKLFFFLWKTGDLVRCEINY